VSGVRHGARRGCAGEEKRRNFESLWWGWPYKATLSSGAEVGRRSEIGMRLRVVRSGAKGVGLSKLGWGSDGCGCGGGSVIV